MKKIKIFLGAYVNFPNAQNVNCDNIAQYLDKEKFEVHTMYTNKKPIDKKAYKDQDIRLHKLIHHRFIWYWCKYLTMLFGNYDIYYLPKIEEMDRRFAQKHRNKICIASVEGVITENTNNTDDFKKYYTEDMTNFFSISNCIADSVKKYWGMKSEVIPLGTIPIGQKVAKKNRLNNIIWVGNVKSNKRPQYFLQIAKSFMNLQFKMIGDGDMLEDMKRICIEENINNIAFYGRIPNSQVYQGLPKVIQEAAQMRIPSIYINENYNVDFISDGVNGFEVSDLIKMQEKVQVLLDNPETYRKMSIAAYESIQPYTWENVIKQYEEYFEKVYEQKRGK